MPDGETVWTKAARDANLDAEEEWLVEQVCSVEPDLREELAYLLAHLSADLGGRFFRTYVDELRARGVAPEAAAAAVGSALAATIDSSPEVVAAAECATTRPHD